MFTFVFWLAAPLVGLVVETFGAASVVVKLKTKSAVMLSGGSIESWSLTWDAKTVVVQVSFCPKSTLGLIVNVVGPPVTTVSATLRVPLEVQTI